MPTTSTPLAPTVGEISRRTGVSIHRVEYIIRARNIQPSSRAGNVQIFSEVYVEHIASELRRIDEEKEGHHV